MADHGGVMTEEPVNSAAKASLTTASHTWPGQYPAWRIGPTRWKPAFS
jgi:hypothetical protein